MVHFFVHRGLKTKELLKNTKNITFTSTIEEVHSQITQKSNQKTPTQRKH